VQRKWHGRFLRSLLQGHVLNATQAAQVFRDGKSVRDLPGFMGLGHLRCEFVCSFRYSRGDGSNDFQIPRPVVPLKLKLRYIIVRPRSAYFSCSNTLTSPSMSTVPMACVSPTTATS
jgi:hypothetical protein